MYVRTLSQSTPIARKEHLCNASWFFCDYDINIIRGAKYSFSEWRAIIKARNNNWKIQKGQKYLNQRNVQEGQIYTFKAIPEIHDLCVKHDLYNY